MESKKKEKLIIEGNAIYEIDLECWNQKQKKEEDLKYQNEKKSRQGN